MRRLSAKVSACFSKTLIRWAIPPLNSLGRGINKTLCIRSRRYNFSTFEGEVLLNARASSGVSQATRRSTAAKLFGTTAAGTLHSLTSEASKSPQKLDLWPSPGLELHQQCCSFLFCNLFSAFAVNTSFFLWNRSLVTCFLLVSFRK